MRTSPKLPLQFLRDPTRVLTRPVSPIAEPEAPQLSVSRAPTFQNQKRFGAVFARQMGTARSSSTPRGRSRRDEEDEDEDAYDVDDENALEKDDYLDESDGEDSDGQWESKDVDYSEEEEEKPQTQRMKK